MCVIVERVPWQRKERCDNIFLRFIREIFFTVKQSIDVCRVEKSRNCSWKLSEKVSLKLLNTFFQLNKEWKLDEHQIDTVIAINARILSSCESSSPFYLLRKIESD